MAQEPVPSTYHAIYPALAGDGDLSPVAEWPNAVSAALAAIPVLPEGFDPALLPLISVPPDPDVTNNGTTPLPSSLTGK